MPQECENCGNNFPTTKVIDGKRRNLSSRKYCLECSPFGEHNTKQLHKHEADGEERGEQIECNLCGETYQYSPSDESPRYCSSCIIRRKRIAYAKAIAQVLGDECQRCSYDECLSALSVHHLGDKEFRFSKASQKAYSAIAQELKDAALLCENCHATEHCDGLRGLCEYHDWDGCCTQEDPCDTSCRVMNLRQSRRLEYIEAEGGRCSLCGYSSCTAALSFHHREEEEKEFRLDAAAFSRSHEALQEEVEKCILLCHNCHRQQHCECEVRCSSMFDERAADVMANIVEEM